MQLQGDVLDVARSLLGAHLVHGEVRVRLTEVEAYAGADDPASHAWRGPTPRTEVMFGPAGRLYVYRSYGLHWCANVVTGVDGVASAVLLRAGEVVDGVDAARARRGPRVADVGLARGPANLTSALGIDGDDDAHDLLVGDRLRLEARLGPAPVTGTGPRVGVSRAADVPWRLWIDGDPTVSAYRRSPRAPAAG
ncbi:DNA-3-methyladenine glycosylase [Solicola sp. PLA-1-18]|uniref:DNA-3-methyladenine glycosylase n=1 Tax=Solicola sp. PLA-1-18 TaxID=3380532 RepID=UPI003B7B8A5E